MPQPGATDSTTLTRLRAASDYALAHMAAHLHAAGQRDRLHQLLTGGRAWMDVKFERSASHAGYVADMELARSQYTDPVDGESLCRVLELHAARLVLNARVVLDTDIDLEVLVRLGREREALEVARLRNDPHEVAKGLLLVERLLRDDGQPLPPLLDEIAQVLPSVQQGWQRGYATRDLALALHAAGYRDESRALAFAIEHPPAREAALSALLSAAIVEQRDDAEALDALLALARGREADNERAAALGNAAVLALRMGDGERARNLFAEAVAAIDQIEDPKQRLYALRDYAIDVADAGFFEEALSQAETIDDEFQRGMVLRRCADAMREAGERASVVDLLRRIPRLTSRIDALAAFATVWIAEGDSDAGCALLREAESLAEGIEGGENSYLPWRELAVAWQKAGRRDDAERCFERAWAFAEREPYSRGHALSQVAHAYIDCGRCDDVEGAIERVDEPESRRYLLRDFALALAKTGDREWASDVFEAGRAQAASVGRKYDDADVGTAVTAALVNARELDAASAVATRIRESVWQRGAISNVAEALVGAGRTRDAIALARVVEDATVRDEVLQKLAETLTARDETGTAAQLASDICDAERRAKTLQPIVRALAGQNPDAALRLAQRFQNDDRFVNPVGDVIVALVRRGEIERARGLVEQIGVRRKRSWALRESAQALAAMGRLDAALALNDEIADGDVRDYGLESIAVALRERGELESSEAVAQRLGRGKRAELFADLAPAYAERGQLERARLIALSIPKSVGASSGVRWRDLAVSRVIDACSTAGRIDEAHGLLEEVADDTLRDVARLRVAAALAATGRDDEAAELRASAQSGSVGGKDIAKRVKALAEAGKTEEALELAAQIDDRRDRGYAELDVVRVLADARHFDEAREVAERVHSNEERGKAFLVLASAFVERGRFEEAIATTDANPGIWERKEARAEIAQALADMNRFVAALDAVGLVPLDDFLQLVCGWSSAIEDAAAGQTRFALVRVLRVAGWADPAWSALADVISSSHRPK